MCTSHTVVIIKFEKMQVFISHISGKFTVPLNGVYMITFSYETNIEAGEEIGVYLNKDGLEIQYVWNKTFDHKSYGVRHYLKNRSNGLNGGSIGGLATYQRLEAGNDITLMTEIVTGHMFDLTMCVQFLHE